MKWMGIAAVWLAASGGLAGENENRLWYTRPAGTNWVAALPVGNGRMGAMVFGGVPDGRIQFNESTLWTGEPHDYARSNAVAALPEIRRLIFAKRQREAESLALKSFMSVPLHQCAYQPCGDLHVRLLALSAPTNVVRTLDFARALHTVRFTDGGTAYVEETFAPYTHPGLLVHRVSADRPGAVSCEITLSSPHEGVRVQTAPDGAILLSGRVRHGAVKFAVRCEIIAAGAGAKRSGSGAGTVVTGADRVELRWSAATNVKAWNALGGDSAAVCRAALAEAAPIPYEKLLIGHEAVFGELFNRVSLRLPSGAAAGLPTDERLAMQRTQPDPSFAALVFQYGRYLLLSCSRPGGEPANLQGIWNDLLNPPWASKMTCNINTEMNYWPAEVTALPECHEALFRALDELAVSGRSTAREHYGAPGWVLHHNFDLWRGTAPVDGPTFGVWPAGSGWLSLHLWEHYLFTRDATFLRQRAWPVMREAARFYSAVLIAHPQTGHLVTCPSLSPEHGGLVAGPAMDSQIIRSLFRACLKAADLVGEKSSLVETLRDQVGRIEPNRIGRYGQLQEWIEDVDRRTDAHRHPSHLWALFPGSDITWRDPALFAAARNSLIGRGDKATGWSMGWKINLWARALDGDHALRILTNLLQPQTGGAGGLYPNLFDAHPPFQIDGNFGATSGIAEMLLQSHVTDGQGRPFIHLLPALPAAWPSGSFRGLRARGGFTIDADWAPGRATRLTVHSSAALPAVVKYHDALMPILPRAGVQTFSFP